MIANLPQLQFIDAEGNPCSKESAAGTRVGNLRRWNDGRFEALRGGAWVAAQPHVCNPLPT